MKPLFTWLHLSDIHFGHGDANYFHDQRLILSQITSDVSHYSNHSIPKPDVIFVTGDISFSGNSLASDEYERAEKWLIDISGALNINQEDIYTVPGNHDIQRNVYNQDHETKRLLDTLRGGQEPIDRAISGSDVDKERLRKRLENSI